MSKEKMISIKKKIMKITNLSKIILIKRFQIMHLLLKLFKTELIKIIMINIKIEEQLSVLKNTKKENTNIM
jgi:hypothetical protein